MNVARFRHLLHAVLAATPVCAAACTNDPTDMPERATCSAPGTSARYAPFTVGPGVDGIAFAARSTTAGAATSTGTPAPLERLPALGTPCARASDPDACAYRVAELLNDPAAQAYALSVSCGGGFGCGTQLEDVAVITKGDEIIRVTSFDEVVGAITPIETRDEAAALLVLRNGNLDCDRSNARPESDGWTFKKTWESCDGEIAESFWRVTRDGKVTLSGRRTVEEGDNSCIEGRRPAGLAATHVAWLASLADCFAEIAHMEAAAVLAFDDLERTLAALDAPWELRMRARRARHDEVAHAAMTSELAARFGGRPRAPRVDAPMTTHDAFTLALENAVEGCVREAYGALVAAHQAAHASDPAVRAAFARIARDEAEHAELSFALDAWLATRLSPRERAEVEAAKARAWSELEAGIDVEPAEDVVRIAGMPTAHMARHLLAQLEQAAVAA